MHVKPAIKTVLLNLLLLIVAAAVVAALFVYSGAYDVAADVPHWSATSKVLERLRINSVERRAAAVQVPPLDDPALRLKGAGQYAEMCVSCHLAPGVEDTALRQGLYPKPPNLATPAGRVDPKAAFWVVKHGVKMTGMPAWGASHDDETIWSIVAFLQQLPELSPAQYADVVAKAPPDAEMAHAHGGSSKANDPGQRKHTHSHGTKPHSHD